MFQEGEIGQGWKMPPKTRDRINKNRDIGIIILSTASHRDPTGRILNNLEVISAI